MRTRRSTHCLQSTSSFLVLLLLLPAIATASIDEQRRGGGGSGAGVKPTLDATHSVHARLTPEAGGTLQLTDAAGTIYVLTLPPQALLTPQDVTMTAIKSIAKMPFTPGFAAGVEIGPAGMRFEALARLAITPLQPVPLAQETTFGYRTGGSQFFLFPAESGQRAVVLDILHTGGYGLAAGTQAQQMAQLAKKPPKPEDQFEQRFWQEQWQARQALPGAALEALLIDLAGGPKDGSSFLSQEATTLDGRLQTISSTCAGRKSYGPWAKAFVAAVNQLGAQDILASQVFQVEQALVQGDKLCYLDATTACIHGDHKQPLVALQWWGQLIRDKGTALVDPSLLETCLTFDLEFDTLVLESNPAPEGYLISSSNRIDTHTVVHFPVTGPVMPIGEGSQPNNYMDAQWLGGGPLHCTISATGNRTPDTFTVKSLILEGNSFEDSPPPPSIDLVYAPGQPQAELKEDCTAGGGSVTTYYLSLFAPSYDVLHFLEDPAIVAPGSPHELFVYEPYEQTWKVSQGSLWANRGYSDSLSIGNIHAQESTELNLFHKPGLP